jgi:hypothetical protein
MMSFLNKIMFWKKDSLDIPEFKQKPSYDGYSQDRTGFNQDLSSRSDIGLDKEPWQSQDSFQYPKTGLESTDGFGNSFEPEHQGTLNQPASFTKLNQAHNSQQPVDEMDSIAKNIEIINAKIETVKSMLDFINHKVDKIEKIAEGEQQKTVSKRYQW